MRVIAGTYRSRKLKGPGLLRLRPTSDRLRETIFNVLGPEIKDSLFVDVYAGTGAIGIEALSRGAREVFWIDSNPKAAALVRRNLESLQIPSAGQLICADALESLKKLAARHLLADFLFVDPPYGHTDECTRILEYLDEGHLVAPQGRVLVEHDTSIAKEIPNRLTRLERSRIVEQGDSAVSFYRLALAA